MLDTLVIMPLEGHHYDDFLCLVNPNNSKLMESVKSFEAEREKVKMMKQFRKVTLHLFLKIRIFLLPDLHRQ